MRHSCLLVAGLFCGFLSTAIGSYDGGYASTHDLDDLYESSYPAPPIVHPHHGHGHGQSAGSYYHYHVPLVGQQHYQPPAYHHQDHSHYLWPLLLLLALPLLFLPLLPLLLLPLGISLLALLAPGGMMMMMMMMMMGGEMMMRRTDITSGRAFSEMRTFGDVILQDMTSLVSKYARSLDLDQCPQRVACEMGSAFFPENNSTDASTAKAFSSFIMEQYLPKGKVRRMVKQYEKAFWTGSSDFNACKAFQCQPTFKLYKPVQKEDVPGSVNGTAIPEGLTAANQSKTHSTVSYRSEVNKNFNYVFPHSKTHSSSNEGNSIDELQLKSTTEPPSPKKKRSHFTNYRYGGKSDGQQFDNSNWNYPKKKYL